MCVIVYTAGSWLALPSVVASFSRSRSEEMPRANCWRGHSTHSFCTAVSSPPPLSACSPTYAYTRRRRQVLTRACTHTHTHTHTQMAPVSTQWRQTQKAARRPRTASFSDRQRPAACCLIRAALGEQLPLARRRAAVAAQRVAVGRLARAAALAARVVVCVLFLDRKSGRVREARLQRGGGQSISRTQILLHTQQHTYIYMHVCVCICVPLTVVRQLGARLDVLAGDDRRVVEQVRALIGCN